MAVRSIYTLCSSLFEGPFYKMSKLRCNLTWQQQKSLTPSSLISPTHLLTASPIFASSFACVDVRIATALSLSIVASSMALLNVSCTKEVKLSSKPALTAAVGGVVVA